MNINAYRWPKIWPNLNSRLFPWFVSQFLILNNLTMTNVQNISKVAKLEDKKDKDKDIKYVNMCELRNVRGVVPLSWYSAGDDVMCGSSSAVVLSQLGHYVVVKTGHGYGDILPPLYSKLGLEEWVFPLSTTDFVLGDAYVKTPTVGSRLNVFSAMSIWFKDVEIKLVGVGVPVFQNGHISIIMKSAEISPSNEAMYQTRGREADSWLATKGSEPYQLVNPYLLSPGGLDRMLIVHSTGSGKTIVIANIINVWFKHNVTKAIEYWKSSEHSKKEPTTLKRFLDCDGEWRKWGIKKIIVIVPNEDIAQNTRDECVAIRGFISDVVTHLYTNSQESLIANFFGKNSIRTATRQLPVPSDRIKEITTPIFLTCGYVAAGNQMPWYTDDDGVIRKHTADTMYTAGQGNRMSKTHDARFECENFCNPLDDSVVIMDEFHNACNDSAIATGAWRASIPRLREGLVRAAHNVNGHGSVVVGLTATPVTENVDELRVAINILRGKDAHPIGTDWLTIDGNITERAKRAMQGYVSVYDVVNDFHLFPSVEPSSSDPLFQQPRYVHVDWTNSVKKTYEKHNRTHTSERINIKESLKTRPMFEIGENVLFLNDEEYANGEILRVENVKDKNVKDKKAKDKKVKDKAKDKKKTAKNIVIKFGKTEVTVPSNDVFKTVYETIITVPGESPDRMRKYCLMNAGAARGLEFSPNPKISEQDNPKVAKMVSMINTSRIGKKLVFCDYNAIGLAATRAMLLMNGWVQWTNMQTTPPKDGKRRFMLLNGHGGEEGNSSSQVQRDALRWFMEKKSSKYGEFDPTGHRVELALLLTPLYYQGVDFKSIRTVYILDPPSDMRIYTQLIGRVRRMCSHANLESMREWKSEIVMFMLRCKSNIDENKKEQDNESDAGSDESDAELTSKLVGSGGVFKLSYKQLMHKVDVKSADISKIGNDDESPELIEYRNIYNAARKVSPHLETDLGIVEMLNEQVSFDVWTWIKTCAAYLPTKSVLYDLKGVAVDCVANSARHGKTPCSALVLSPVEKLGMPSVNLSPSPYKMSPDDEIHGQNTVCGGNLWLTIPYIRGLMDSIIQQRKLPNTPESFDILATEIRDVLKTTFVKSCVSGTDIRPTIKELYDARRISDMVKMIGRVLLKLGNLPKLVMNVNLKDITLPSRIAWYASRYACPFYIKGGVVVNTEMAVQNLIMTSKTRATLLNLVKAMRDRNKLLKKLPLEMRGRKLRGSEIKRRLGAINKKKREEIKAAAAMRKDIEYAITIEKPSDDQLEKIRAEVYAGSMKYREGRLALDAENSARRKLVNIFKKQNIEKDPFVMPIEEVKRELRKQYIDRLIKMGTDVETANKMSSRGLKEAIERKHHDKIQLRAIRKEEAKLRKQEKLAKKEVHALKKKERAEKNKAEAERKEQNKLLRQEHKKERAARKEARLIEMKERMLNKEKKKQEKERLNIMKKQEKENNMLIKEKEKQEKERLKMMKKQEKQEHKLKKEKKTIQSLRKSIGLMNNAVMKNTVVKNAIVKRKKSKSKSKKERSLSEARRKLMEAVNMAAYVQQRDEELLQRNAYNKEIENRAIEVQSSPKYETKEQSVIDLAVM